MGTLKREHIILNSHLKKQEPMHNAINPVAGDPVTLAVGRHAGIWLRKIVQRGVLQLATLTATPHTEVPALWVPQGIRSGTRQIVLVGVSCIVLKLLSLRLMASNRCGRLVESHFHLHTRFLLGVLLHMTATLSLSKRQLASPPKATHRLRIS
jgi:hypothetical protein